MKNYITIEGAKLVFRNFEGLQKQFNPKGKRNFCVLLSDEDATKLCSEGYNIKYLKPRDEDDTPRAYLQIIVNYDNYPPEIYMVIANKGKTLLDEETVKLLDTAELENVDLQFRPYHWEINGKEGTTAYLTKMYATIEEDEFDDRYSDIPNC